MRQIGTIAGQEHAEAFSDYLLTLGIENMAEEGGSGWAIWVHRDDDLERAQRELAGFVADPGNPRFHQAAKTATKMRREQEVRDDRLRRNYYDVRTRWATPQQWNVPVTLALMVMCGVVAVLTSIGQPKPGSSGSRVETGLQIAYVSPHGFYRVGLYDIRHGQVWRLVTPIFLHYGILHLVFNLMMLRDLGGGLERHRGSLRFAGLVLVSSIVSNLAQYWWSGPGFGGMSGVLYALFGYAWMTGKFRPQLGLVLNESTVTIMLVWLVLCMTGLVGNIANAAHVAGLVVGMAIAYAPVLWRRVT